MAITDYVDVNISVADRVSSVTSFGETLILTDEADGVISNRTKQYTVDDYLIDFPLTTKTGTAIAAHFSQDPHNATIKVGKIASGDANITASIAAIRNEDDDWFHLISTKKEIADKLRGGR